MDDSEEICLKNMNNLIITNSSAELLSSGLLSLYLPHLKETQQQLTDLTKRQELIWRQLHEENIKLCEGIYCPELKEMFTTIFTCKENLRVIKSKMSVLHDKSCKLKKRVLKLEQNKQYEAKLRAQKRDKEEQLIGKHPD